MKSNKLKALTSNDSDEHNTPEYIIEAAKEVLGDIDLDPMSNELANQVIRATQIYTKEDNGLDKEWFGRVWLNPPFSLSDKAVPKLIHEYKEGRVIASIILLKSAVETKRYQLLYPYPFCELNKRVKFIPNGTTNTNSPPFATVLFYLGKRYYKWNEVMSKLGRVHLGKELSDQLISCNDKYILKLLGVIE